jgi:DinB superfamily
MTDRIDLRYPIGPFRFSERAAFESRAEHIAALRQLPAQLSAAIEGLDIQQIDTPYREGGWTVKQLVHHIADSHANACIRMKLALTEDWPTIKPYDEAAWAELADSHLLPVAVSLQLTTALHARWVCLLETLGEDDFRRGYVHPGMTRNGGRQHLDEVLALYAWHSRHHLAHIVNLRQRMGW